ESAGLVAGSAHRRRRALRPHGAVPVPAHPPLASLLSQGPHEGGGSPPQGLRHAGGRKDAASGLPLSIPLARLCREEWIRLSRDSGALESDDLNASTVSPRILLRLK